MGFDPFGVNAAHLAYVILGGYVCVFSLLSLFIKEKLYIGEATVATIIGIIFGPVALNLFNPFTWGNTDMITLELSRIVLIVQVFAVGVELPKAYMYRHWKSLFLLLVPVMAFGWVISSAFIYWLIPALSFVDSLIVGACVTATDPVLASSVVGKGKFAKRVPGHLRNLLSAESGSNDGMAFPFLYLGLYIILDSYNTGQAIKDWILISVLYEVVMGTVLGALIGIALRKAIKFAERRRMIDRESFLSFYFVLAIFCAGVGTLLGTDDLLVSFSAGCAFTWDGWFTKKTEESHVSNVIDLLFNLSFFVYYGSIIPWSSMNSPLLTIVPWRLVVIAIFILLFRRIPILLALSPFIPDLESWREALFCGHFGPIGVGAIFISILARAELETGHGEPLASLPTDPSTPNYILILSIWPIVSFLILSSIVVHGSSIAVFTLGKHLNTLSFTITNTQDIVTDQASSVAWSTRLSRMSFPSRPLSRGKKGEIGPISAPQEGRPYNSNTFNPEGPEGLGAVSGADIDNAPEVDRGREGRHVDEEKSHEAGERMPVGGMSRRHEAWREGDNIIIEDEMGEVIRTIRSPKRPELEVGEEKAEGEGEGIAGRLRRMWSGRREDSHERKRNNDLEQGVSEGPETSENRRKSDSYDSSKKPSKGPPPIPPSGPVFVVDEESRRSLRISDAIRRQAKREREEETEVERRRREAVLGITHDSDDSGEQLSCNKDKQPGNSSDDEDLDGAHVLEGASQSQSGSGDQAQSSRSGTSGTQLLHPSLARTRGIRFGDVSVGSESFSLEEGPPSVGGTRHHKTGSGHFRRSFGQ